MQNRNKQRQYEAHSKDIKIPITFAKYISGYAKCKQPNKLCNKQDICLKFNLFGVTLDTRNKLFT